ncbi:hypothetical protein JZ751_019789, partial [Albula glossodonta]
LVGIFLNGLTLVSFLKIRELRTPSNFLVFSLAMADIGICMNATVAAFSSFLRSGFETKDVGERRVDLQGALVSDMKLYNVQTSRSDQNLVCFLMDADDLLVNNKQRERA